MFAEKRKPAWNSSQGGREQEKDYLEGWRRSIIVHAQKNGDAINAGKVRLEKEKVDLKERDASWQGEEESLSKCQ